MGLNINIGVFAGNLTGDTQTRRLTSGTVVANNTIAINRFWYDGSGEKRKKTAYIPLVFWGKIAERASELTKGANVHITGEFETETWEARDGSGQQRSRLVLNCHTLQVIGLKRTAPATEEPQEQDQAEVEEEEREEVSSPSALMG